MTSMIEAVRRSLPRRELRIFRGTVRIFRGTVECRGASSAPLKIAMRIPYNSASADLGFTEFIAPGAFSRSLQDRATDVVSLWNHDPNFPLGRQGNGTLKITDGADALEGVVTLDQNNAMHTGTFAPCVARGDVIGSSFGFDVPDGGDRWEHGRDGSVKRTLLEVHLLDLSPCTFPAYPDSEAESRAFIASLLGAHRRPSLAQRTGALRDRELALREHRLAEWQAAARR